MSILLDQRVFETAPPDIMRGQIEHLINLGDQPHVTLRIVPQGTGWYVGLVGPFHMITSARRTVVFVDAPGGGRLVKGQETGEFGTRWERISGHALPCEASRNLLVNLMEGLA